jgi:ABC-2 type transport system ATP-binding protein
MQDIEALTDRIILIGKGRILLDGPLSELKRRYSGHKTITLIIVGKCRSARGIKYTSSFRGRASVAVDSSIISYPQR